jgi:nucleoside recognition membrane protein YjiH
LINSIPLSVGNTIIVSLVCSIVGVLMARSHAPAEALAQMPPFPVMWLGSWAKLLLPTLIVSYILAVVLSPIVSQAIGMADAGAEVGRAASGKDD